MQLLLIGNNTETNSVKQKKMDIAHYFNYPEELNKETLYDLRKLIAIYPFYQPARILLLKTYSCYTMQLSMKSCDVQLSTLQTVECF